MRKPNDKKRANTKGSAETRERQRNLKYVHVSKRLLEVPVHMPGCEIFQKQPCTCLTKIKEVVAERKGTTYQPYKDAGKRLAEINGRKTPVSRKEIRIADRLIDRQTRKPGFQGAA